MAAMYAVQLAMTDDPARLALRPAHRERLAGLAADGQLLAAGPWSDDTGALLVFVVGSRDELDAIMAADPYYRPGDHHDLGPGVEPGDPPPCPRRTLRWAAESVSPPQIVTTARDSSPSGTTRGGDSPKTRSGVGHTGVRRAAIASAPCP